MNLCNFFKFSKKNKIESTKIKNFHKAQYFNEGTIFFPLFDKEIQILVDFDVDVEYAEKCVTYLNELSDKVIDDLCNASILYLEDYRQYFEDFEIDIPINISGR